MKAVGLAGDVQGGHPVFTVPQAVASLAELGEQCQPVVLAQPLGPWGKKPWLPSAGWDSSESF